MRLLLDTNILIPLQDSFIRLDGNLKNLIRLANKGGHQLLYHPASLVDIERDNDIDRRSRTLSRIDQYEKLEATNICPWNHDSLSPNDKCDNEILYALECNAAHALITEDRKLHNKAREKGLANRTYNIQTAEDWLRRLHEPTEVQFPNIEDIPIYTISPELNGSFFDSLRSDYTGFNNWFAKTARDGRKAWISRDDSNQLGAICIYAEKFDERVSDNGDRLYGKSLKLCTFKVGDTVRGRKIGELFLKASFRYASENSCEHIFIHGNEEKQHYLASLLNDFGFIKQSFSYGGDAVWIKKHPLSEPSEIIDAKDFVRLYYPHYRQDLEISKFLVPIQPNYHNILFPDHSNKTNLQLNLFQNQTSHVGNAIKLAYICRAQIKSINPGDILLFYRSDDEKSITSIGIVDDFLTSNDPEEISAKVSRRTVYSFHDISKMTSNNGDSVKVILFRLIKHIPTSVPFKELKRLGILSGPPQSILRLDEIKYRSFRNAAKI